MHEIRDRSNKWLLMVDYHTLIGPQVLKHHCHPFLELSCVVRGSGTYCINGDEYTMQAGDIFLFAPTDQHHIKLRKERMEHLVIHMEPSFIWNGLGNDMDYQFLMMFFQRSERFRCRLDRDNPAGERLRQWFSEIWQECQEQQLCCDLMIKIKLQSILAQILRNYDCIDTHKPVGALPNQELKLINRVLAYVDEHLAEDIRLADLAATAHVSVSYFSMLFKRYNGLPPMEYVVARRIQRAVEYIRTTPLSLAEIAALCGFNNTTNFYKAFRKVTGRTPATYRKAPVNALSQYGDKEISS